MAIHLKHDVLGERMGHPPRLRKKKTVTSVKERLLFLGLDGEGQGSTQHVYNYLAAVDEEGKRLWSVENQAGIGTYEALTFLFSLPSRAKLFTYFFQYDLTKMLQDLSNEELYLLWRPGLRRGKDGTPMAIKWRGFKLNMRASKFLIQKGMRRIVIWDIGKFYQSKFVDALQTWRVGEDDVLEHMANMKEKRSEFDKVSHEEVQSYCQTECRYLAALARKLWEAHIDVDLKLKSFYGAGSTASAILEKINVQQYMKPTIPEMVDPVARSFFGGRFEDSVLGAIRKPIFGKDISSAYPYQLTFLPCLAHSEWKFTKNRADLDKHSHALVNYHMRKKGKYKLWGPFPHRDKEGSICFPVAGNTGWVWQDEYLQGEKVFDNVQFLGAWLMVRNCDCKPFETIPKYYNERCRIGKDGPGIVLKLGPNSVYGKVAQSVGDAPFNSWIWAAMITSGCRAQCLELFSLHEDIDNILAIATDGLYSLEDVKGPAPRFTGTEETGKPLGGWETEHYPEGMFFARPGIYFPLDASEDKLKKIRGRGLGKKTVFEHKDRIIREYEKFGIDHSVVIGNVSRFCGAKTSISRSGRPGSYTYKRAYALPGMNKRSYGQWIGQRIEMSFNQMPKRVGLNPDGVSLKPRVVNTPSEPYGKSLGREMIRLMAMKMQADEQPDATYTDFEPEQIEMEFSANL